MPHTSGSGELLWLGFWGCVGYARAGWLVGQDEWGWLLMRSAGCGCASVDSCWRSYVRASSCCSEAAAQDPSGTRHTVAVMLLYNWHDRSARIHLHDCLLVLVLVLAGL